MRFQIEMGEDLLTWAQGYFDRRCTLIGDDSSEVLDCDRFIGMVLGAAKAGGWGKRKKSKGAP